MQKQFSEIVFDYHSKNIKPIMEHSSFSYRFSRKTNKNKIKKFLEPFNISNLLILSIIEFPKKKKHLPFSNLS